jgi:hypothetical protein
VLEKLVVQLLRESVNKGEPNAKKTILGCIFVLKRVIWNPEILPAFNIQQRDKIHDVASLLVSEDVTAKGVEPINLGN